MILDILILYFLGLALLFLSDFLGLCFLKFGKVSVFTGVFMGYLFVISTYAIYKSNFNSIGFLVLFWVLGYVFFISKKGEMPKIKRQDYLQRFLIIVILWTVIFGLKVGFFWNSAYNCPNLFFVDYECYMKMAEGYNLSGNENALGLRNVLLPFLNFAQPFRSNDFWLVSLGLDLTKIDTIYIWELFYSPILISMCSFSLFGLLKRKYNIFISLIFSILILFAFTGEWYRSIINLLYNSNPGSYDPIGIVAYTKLILLFPIFFQFYSDYQKGKQKEAIYFLILIPLLVQSAVATFLLIFLLILFLIFKEKTKSIRNIIMKYRFIICFAGLFVAFFGCFYLLNQDNEKFYVGHTNANIISYDGVLEFVIQFFKKLTLLLISYYWLSFLLAIVLLISVKSLHKNFRFELFVITLLCYISSALVYAKYNKIGDSYQLSTNVFGPFILSLIIYLLIQSSNKTSIGKIHFFILAFVSIQGMRQTIGGDNVFNSTIKINKYEIGFIDKMRQILPKLEYPFGVIYYGENTENQSKEEFPQHETTFLKLFGRYYDVFNIEADSLKKDYTNKANQKINLNISRNSLNIWIRNQERIKKTKEKLGGKDFYAAYPFSFCISKKPKDSLPNYIKADIVNIIRDNKAKIYFYSLKRKP